MITDDAITLGNIEEALQQFYREPTNNKVAEFLVNARLSKYAWSLSLEILRANKPLSVKIYAADTLHFKIVNQWHQFHKNDMDILIKSLMMFLESNKKALVVKICECLACIILQTAIEIDIISYLIGRIGSEVNEWKKTYFLETLTVIPEKLSNLDMSQNKRACVEIELRRCNSSSIFQMIYHIIEDKSNQDFLKNQALRCFKNWLSIDVSAFHYDGETLVFMVFDLLRQPACFTCSAEALRQFFKFFKSERGTNQPLMKYLQKVAELSPLFDSESDDIDVSHSLTEIIVSAAVNNSEVILSSLDNSYSKVAFKLLELILKTVNVKGQYPTEELCSNISFDFWSKLQKNLEEESYPFHVKDVVEEKILEMFDIMINKTKYPHENVYTNWEADEKEKFESYRQDFAKTAASFFKFTGFQPIMKLIKMLSNHCEKHLKSTEVEWQEFESIIHLMTSIVKAAHKNELDCIEQINALILCVPCTHNTLKKQIILFLGSYSEKMDDQMFVHSINFVLESLRVPEISSDALKTLRALLLHKKGSILLVNEDVIRGLKECVDAAFLETSDYAVLARCLVYLLPLMAQDDALMQIKVFLMPQFDDLISADKNKISNLIKKKFFQKLKMLSGFFVEFSFSKDEIIDSSHFIFQFLEQLFPCILQVIHLNILDENTIDELFTMLQSSAVTYRRYPRIAAPLYCELVSTAYSLNPMPRLLNFAKTLFSIISNHEQLMPIIQSTIDLMHKKTLTVLEHVSENHTDLLKEFLDFSIEILKKNPTLLNCESIDLCKLCSVALEGIKFSDDSLNESSCRFLDSLISKIDLTEVIQVLGRKFMLVIIFAILGFISETNLNVLASVMKSLLSRYFDFVKNTLTEMFSDDIFPVSHMSNLTKRQFLCKIITPLKSRINVERIFLEFAEIWRNRPSEKLDESDEIVMDIVEEF